MVGQITTKIELAFGANLTADPATWTYTDLSTRGLGSVTVRAGRADEASQTQPTQCTFRLANTDGALTPRFPTSPYYPNVRRQTPVRISLNPGTGYVQRFQGYIDSITPTWPSGNSTVAEVTVVASGSLRRLGQGTAQLLPAIQRVAVANSPAQYVPLSDGVFATQLASGLPGVAPITAQLGDPLGLVTAVAQFAGGQLAPWMSQGVSVANGSHLLFYTPTVGSSQWALDLVVNMGTNRGTNPGPWSFVYVAGNTAYPRVEWSIDTQPASATSPLHDQVNFLYYVVTGPNTSTSNVLLQQDHSVWDGLPHHLRMTVAQSGPNINWSLFIDGQQFSGTVTSQTLQAPTSLEFNPQFQQTPTFLVGQVALWNTATPALSATTAASAVMGYAGETASTRVSRLCGEQSVPIAITGSSTAQMGPQGVGTLVNLLRECEAVDSGILYDGGSAGLAYLASSARYNQAAALALDCNRYQVKLPFAPVEDDQRVRNDWTITRPNGSSSHFADANHVAANGLYAQTANANVQLDGQTADQASWRVHLGTVEEMRLPTLTFDPLHSPELQTQWFATTLGQRVTATNLPTQYPLSSTDQIIEGYTETWDSVTWSVTLNLSPYRPWEVLTIQDARLGRIETDGSTLTGGPYSSSAGSFSVASSGGLWDTGSTPFDVEIEGEQITVTSITGSSSPQTFAVTRSINGVVKAHSTGAVVKLWRPGVLAL